MTQRDSIFNRGRGRVLPVLPFGGHSGSMGSDASRERAAREDEAGVTEWRQRQVLQLLEQAGPIGMTYQEVGRILGWHHGQTTGVLSPMHGAGLIAALADTRDNCTVYVAPQHVGKRETRAYGGGKNAAQRSIIADLQAEIRTLQIEISDTKTEISTAKAWVESTNQENQRLAARVQELEAIERSSSAEVRTRGSLLELSEQTIAAHEVTIENLKTQNIALRSARALTGLDGDEVALAETLVRALAAVEGMDGERTVPVKVSSLRTFAGIARRLLVGRSDQVITEE